jgi:hypothetical protein
MADAGCAYLRYRVGDRTVGPMMTPPSPLGAHRRHPQVEPVPSEIPERLAWLAEVGVRIAEDADALARQLKSEGLPARVVLRQVMWRAAAMSDQLILAVSMIARRVLADEDRTQ